jgi:hypothetical protein
MPPLDRREGGGGRNVLILTRKYIAEPANVPAIQSDRLKNADRVLAEGDSTTAPK